MDFFPLTGISKSNGKTVDSSQMKSSILSIVLSLYWQTSSIVFFIEYLLLEILNDFNCSYCTFYLVNARIPICTLTVQRFKRKELSDLPLAAW